MPFQPSSMKIISVDDHLIERPNLWLDRLPKKDHEAAPRVVNAGRLDFWVYEDRAEVYGPGLGAAAGRPVEEWSMQGIGMAEIAPGCIDPGERIKDMDIDGVWAALNFPTFSRFAGTRFLEFRDKELALRCVQAYNDFVFDEWCAAAPDRFIPLCILPLWDSKLAAVEIQRVADRGARSVGFPDGVETLGLPSWHTGYWDPVFAAAAECDVPLSSHIGTGQRPSPVSKDAPGRRQSGSQVCPANSALNGLGSFVMVTDLTFSHVFHKFPNLKIALSEGGIGWISYIKERMDYVWERQKHWAGVADVRPSTLFDKHFWGCFIDEEVGLRERHAIGLNNIMLEIDYPHSDTTWPHTQKRVSELMANVPDDEAHRIVELNARDLFSFTA
jgi:predicted TIM-barrel fold metal-dependent hydrolase